MTLGALCSQNKRRMRGPSSEDSDEQQHHFPTALTALQQPPSRLFPGRLPPSPWPCHSRGDGIPLYVLCHSCFLSLSTPVLIVLGISSGCPRMLTMVPSLLCLFYCLVLIKAVMTPPFPLVPFAQGLVTLSKSSAYTGKHTHLVTPCPLTEHLLGARPCSVAINR